VALLCNNGYDYARGQWAVWRAGGIFVPLCTTHPAHELEYVLKDSEASIAFADKAHEQILEPLVAQNKISFFTLDSIQSKAQQPKSAPKKVATMDMDPHRGAMIVYTR
jgi:malonyl-CoA/methylmalonyl-CoA synthetase